MDKLKPCPFCGDEAEIAYYPNGLNMNKYLAECKNEICAGFGKPYRDEQEAIQAWNRRVGDDE